MSYNKTILLDEQPAESGADMVKTALPINKVFSCEMLAQIFGVDAKRIRNLCSTGQIPFCRRLGRAWIVKRTGAQFLERWLMYSPPLPRLKMRDAAAKLDRSVRARQPELPDEPDRLGDKQVRRIRERYAQGATLGRLGNDYDRDKSAISRIVNGSRYSNVN